MQKTRSAGFRRSVSIPLILLVVFAAAACHKRVERPTVSTYPVTGKVVASRGQLPAAGTLIEFRQKDPTLTAKGLLEADGTFSLKTLYYEKKLPGAAEGTYHVTLYQSINHAPGPQIEIKEPYKVEAKENHISVMLDGQARQ